MVQNPSTTEQLDQDVVLSATGAPVPGRTAQGLHDKKLARKMARVVSRSRKDVKRVEEVISDALPIIDRLLDQK